MATALTIIATIAALLGAKMFFAQRHKAMLLQQARQALSRIYDPMGSVPTAEAVYAYGFPAFTVTFRNKEELAEAETRGLNASFTSVIQGICAEHGSRSNPFDAERAIHFTYAGWTEESLAAHKAAGTGT